MTHSVEPFVQKQLQTNRRRRLLHPPLRGLVPMFCKLRVSGAEQIPVTGATMLIGNHISQIDPILITAAVQGRYVISMAKAETRHHPIQGAGLRIWGNFVVRRGEVDRVALNQAIALLKAKQVLWIAPEGTRNPQGMQAAKSGVAYIAHKANAVVVPTAICGSQHWTTRLKRFERFEVALIFGRPFRFRLPDDERLSRSVREAMMTEAMYQVAMTLPEKCAEQRGIYSDLQAASTNYLEFV